MTLVAITQRVVVDAAAGERRDALDQRWFSFLEAVGLRPLVMPNHADTAAALVRELEPAGVILTGGGDLAAYGGDACERDAAEAVLTQWANQRRRPVLGVCRGMQHLLHRAGVPLERVAGHVRTRHRLTLLGRAMAVNSYHDLAARAVDNRDLEVLARAEDGAVEAIRHRELPQLGIMWHPERESPFAADDIQLFRRHYGVAEAARAACAG